MRIFSRRLSLLVGLAAGSGVVRGQVEIPFTKCDYDHFNIQSVQVNSLPVVAGTDLVLTLTATPDRDIHGGTIRTTTTAMRGMVLGTLELNVCTDLKGIVCPLVAGQVYSGSFSYPIPSYAPAIKVDAHIVMVDENYQQLSCADAQVQLARAGSSQTSSRRLIEVGVDGSLASSPGTALIIEDSHQHNDVTLLKGIRLPEPPHPHPHHHASHPTTTTEATIPYSLCPGSVDVMGVRAVTANEGTVKAGERLTLSVDVTPKRDVKGGVVTVEVSASGVSMGQASFDICTQMGVTCPLAKGVPATLRISQRVPDISLPVTLTANAHITAVDESNAPLTCMAANIKIGRSINFMLAEMGGVESGTSVYDNTPSLRPELLHAITLAGHTTWTPTLHNNRFHNVSVALARRLMGTRLKGEPGFISLPIKAPPADGALVKLSGVFESSVAWPHCAHHIMHVTDQSDCGGCWAFASTAVLNDRMCITNKDSALLSPQDTLSCCRGASCGFSHGCNGGQLSGAWRWFESNGVVSGGDFAIQQDGATCKPVTLPPCADKPDMCKDATKPLPTPQCLHSCSDAKYPKTYQQDKRYASSAYGVSSEEVGIMREIAANGPVTAAMLVYEDFLAYESGVYQHVTGEALGGHAVKIVGWGNDAEHDNTPYWSVVNSWGGEWGHKGTFRILRGQNECGIEDSVVAGAVQA